MDLPLNANEPKVMHIDLNSCFATAEQQANPLLRGKPVGVAAYTTPNGCVLSPSVEAKTYGVKVGMRVYNARLLCPDIIILAPDPPKYRDIHMKFSKLFRDYSPNVSPKSIDEAIIDFTGSQALKRGLVDVGMEIKKRMREEIGEWISCNIGIATNRFLAKLAASLHKPDGLGVITSKNIRSVYESVSLTDLHGINTRFQARLNARGIFTPLEFVDATHDTLKKQVFKSITGFHWYLRLRGWEVDAIDFTRKSYGQSYALRKATNNQRELSQMLMKLCEKMGRRLRQANRKAHGIHVSCLYNDRTHWHRGRLVNTSLYTTQDLYTKVLWVFNQQPKRKKVTNLAVSCYQLSPADREQLTMFDDGRQKQKQIAQAIDVINDRYGEFVVTPALMMGMDKIILDRISFGNIKGLEDLYARAHN